MRSLTITIPGRPPTPNARPGNMMVAYRIRDHWKEIARNSAVAAALDASWPLRSDGLERSRVTPRHFEMRVKMLIAEPIAYAVRYEMTFVCGTRQERDWDNAVASSKPLTDGLVEAGLLAGDSTSYIRSAGRLNTFRYQKGVDAVEIFVVEGEAPMAQLEMLP
jgi:hypothetical protein